MNTLIRTAIAGTVIASVAFAATPKYSKRLTAQRVAELTAPTEAALPKAYRIEIADIGHATLSADKPESWIEAGRDFVFPTEFDPPQPAANGAPVLTPTTPSAFETASTGWTVRLSAKPHGRLVAVYGVADYAEAALVPGGYGAIAGPIYTERGEMLTPNELNQPKFQTTTTRFHIFAVPGEPYDVTFYRGAQEEKHTIIVTLE